MKIRYKMLNIREAKLRRIEQINSIIDEYAALEIEFTLRSLYYKLVSRNIIANNDKEYKRLGDVVADGRLAGLIDWDAISDQTRYQRKLAAWDGPQDIVEACAKQFRLDKWADQDNYLEVYVEKDAVLGVIKNVCESLQVSYMACRGYASATAVWDAGHNRFNKRDRGR